MRFILFSPLLTQTTISFLSSGADTSARDGYSIPEEEGVDFDEGMG
jgi:hypothetical protein